VRHFLGFLTLAVSPLCAGTIPVPNASFETPVTTFVNTNIDFWEKVPKPAWYVESGGYTWSQLIGTFKNTAPGSPQDDHIDNCEGAQAIWMFVVPEVCLFQDYNSADWSHASPIHAFNAKFEVGHAYSLKVGVIGGGGGMLEGASIELSLYYRNGAQSRITVARTSVINTVETFPSSNHFVDFQVDVPVVKASDPWAGQYIGVQILSTVSAELEGGYWDLDNVRLTSTVTPALDCTQSGTDARISWVAGAGHQFQLQFSPDLQSWSNYDAPVSGAGAEVVKLLPTAGQPKGFYRLQITPP
jgi:hypothetical protein